MERNYTSISPSAKALLLMKGLTPIPYAREAAALISRPEEYVPDYSSQEMTFWARVTHFEARYQSIDQLLADLPVTNILEISSGFSFRGLAAAREQAVYYIDTDLPEVVEQKQALLEDLRNGQPGLKGHYAIRALNALDPAAFAAVVDEFPPGPLAIVNEGLLMYLGPDEKRTLCASIRAALQKRGGWWITADVYIRNEKADRALDFKDELQTFLDQHNIERNKFQDFGAAAAFFREAGFVVDREAMPEFEKMTTLPYMLRLIPPDKMEEMKANGRIQATWRLKVAEGM